MQNKWQPKRKTLFSWAGSAVAITLIILVGAPFLAQFNTPGEKARIVGECNYLQKGWHCPIETENGKGTLLIGKSSLQDMSLDTEVTVYPGTVLKDYYSTSPPGKRTSFLLWLIAGGLWIGTTGCMFAYFKPLDLVAETMSITGSDRAEAEEIVKEAKKAMQEDKSKAVNRYWLVPVGVVAAAVVMTFLGI